MSASPRRARIACLSLGCLALALILLAILGHRWPWRPPTRSPSPPTSTTPPARSAQSVAVGDFNGDGKFDLAVANYNDGTVSILLGNGNGTFAAKTDYSAGTPSQSVAVGDFNGDGKADLAVANGYCKHGQHPAWQRQRQLRRQDRLRHRREPRVGRHRRLQRRRQARSGDGELELGREHGQHPARQRQRQLRRQDRLRHRGGPPVGRRRRRQFRRQARSGGGQQQRQHGQHPARQRQRHLRRQDRLRHRLLAAAVVIADFNGDGKKDLAVAVSPANTVRIYLGDGSGTFASHTDYTTGSQPGSVAVGDVNGDGRADLATASWNTNTRQHPAR